MQDKKLFIKIEQNVEVSNTKVYLQDVAKLYSADCKMVHDLNKTELMIIKAKEDMKYIVSIMKVIELIQKKYPNVDIEICDKLKECDFGDFENKSYEDLKDNPDYQKWIDSNGELPFPNGETHEDFKNRCKDGFFESLTERDTAFVIHGGSIMAIMQKLFGGNFYDYQVKNGCGYEFEMRNGEIVDDYSPIGCG